MYKVLNKRSGIGILEYIVVLLSIVLCLGSIFILTLYRPVGDQPLKYTTISFNEQLIEEIETEESVTFVEAVLDLKKEGCNIVYVKAKIYLNNPKDIGYEEFKSKALEAKLVIVTPSDYGNILLVQIKKEQWVWLPD
jgi:hypothetical protein